MRLLLALRKGCRLCEYHPASATLLAADTLIPLLAWSLWRRVLLIAIHKLKLCDCKQRTDNQPSELWYGPTKEPPGIL